MCPRGLVLQLLEVTACTDAELLHYGRPGSGPSSVLTHFCGVLVRACV